MDWIHLLWWEKEAEVKKERKTDSMKAFKDRNLILWTYSTVQGYVQKQVEKSRGSDFMTNTMSLFLCDSVIKVSTCVHMQYEHIRCTLKLLVHFFFYNSACWVR